MEKWIPAKFKIFPRNWSGLIVKYFLRVITVGWIDRYKALGQFRVNSVEYKLQYNVFNRNVHKVSFFVTKRFGFYDKIKYVALK